VTTHLQLVPRSRIQGFVCLLNKPSWYNTYFVNQRDNFTISIQIETKHGST
jgi:hypothetical protein